MSILDYIEKIKRENEGPRTMAQEPRNMAQGGRTGFYKGESVVKSHGDKVVQLADAGESSRSIAKKLGLKQQTVNDAINSIEKGLAGKEYKFSKPFKDIIKLSVNKSGVNLADPKYTDEVIKFIDDNPTFNQSEGAKILGKKRAALVDSKLWGNPGPKWNDEKAKLRNEADKRWFKKYSKPSIETKTSGTRDIHKHHAGGLREKVTTENIMHLKAQDNYKNIRPFEKAMDEIQLKQYKNNLNRSLPASKKKLVFEALAKEEAALRAANPKFSPYKSSLIFEESALGKGTFKFKEVMIDPKLTVSEGKTGQKFAFKKATKKEAEEIIDLTKKSFEEIFKKANIPCIKGVGGNCTTPEDFRKGFNQLVKEAADGKGSKAAISKLTNFTKSMRKLKGAATWTGYGLLAEAGFMVPFAVGDYAAGKSWKRILGNATDYGFGPIFGQSEQEEFEAALPEGSKAVEGEKVLELGERLEKLEKGPKPQGRIGMDKARREKSRENVITGITDEFSENLQPFLGDTPFAKDQWHQGMWTQAHQDAADARAQIAKENFEREYKRNIALEEDFMAAGGGIASLMKKKW